MISETVSLPELMRAMISDVKNDPEKLQALAEGFIAGEVMQALTILGVAFDEETARMRSLDLVRAGILPSRACHLSLHPEDITMRELSVLALLSGQTCSLLITKFRDDG